LCLARTKGEENDQKEKEEKEEKEKLRLSIYLI
jgi:hypothetical protein